MYMNETNEQRLIDVLFADYNPSARPIHASDGVALIEIVLNIVQLVSLVSVSYTCNITFCRKPTHHQISRQDRTLQLSG